MPKMAVYELFNKSEKMNLYRKVVLGMLLAAPAGFAWSQAPLENQKVPPSEIPAPVVRPPAGMQTEAREFPRSHAKINKLVEGGCSATYSPERVQGMQRKTFDGTPISRAAQAPKTSSFDETSNGQ